MTSGLRRIHQHWSPMETVYRIVDAACIIAGLALVVPLATAMTGERYLLIGSASIVMFFVSAGFSGLYRNWRGVPLERELVCSLATWGATLLALMTAAFAVRIVDHTPRSVILCWFAVTPVLFASSRIFLRNLLQTLRARGLNTHTFAIVGVNDLGIQLAKNIEAAPEMGLKLSGFYDDRPDSRLLDLPPSVGEKVGDLEVLVQQARRGEVDRIYIAFPMRAEQRIREVLARLSDSTASVYIVPDFFVFELLHSRWTNISGLPVVSVFENPFYGVDGVIKRISDLVLASIALAMLSLPMLAIAVAIKVTSPGPVFFRQKRYGLDGREILVWKFRSMRVMDNGPQVKQATRNDPRITPLGGLLRRTSLDELPQLFNVLDGSMSLVGPRPHASAHNEAYRNQIQGYMLRHKVKPGITGLAQVNGWRGETDTLEKMARRVECDHQYIREWSIWMDIRILFRTVLVVFKGENAY
ncbi:undecaprenyl-phosphate glucose phosphotransferase [Lignipirellula cremea]|uniref:UDP-glucose:undecaprenyl-phosphate glucose-1-phosphate transferase n=1 Tax=Lignipirellula cremea TaxID=2528010 RepID=A0A518E235_9BACT|nr:undecaprenyl-phosphate glucose phosphotransferase [Lignipirellula cremea]QDU98141.1 UDP-glucose:undecaprenyl-phosphate glucose-1-phosphate transferase [Lignipirellula cremea]